MPGYDRSHPWGLPLSFHMPDNQWGMIVRHIQEGVIEKVNSVIQVSV